MSEFYLEIYLPGLVSGWPNSKWLDGALLGLIQPLHGVDTKHKEAHSSQKLAVLGISPRIFFVCLFPSRTSAAGEQVETQGETNNLNYKAVEEYSTPHSGQLTLKTIFVFPACLKSFLPESIIST